MGHAETNSYTPAYPFSLGDTLKSGQLFHWEPIEIDGISGFAGCIGPLSPSWIAQPSEGEVLIRSEAPESVIRYFGLDQDVERIHASFPQEDKVLTSAIDYCPGIRVARQPLWECLATFITSSLKQVAHIRAISMEIRKRYGVQHQINGCEFYTYPTPGKVAELDEGELRECALGYRAKSLLGAARMVANGDIDLHRVEHEEDDEGARSELLKMHGVGEKIANCTLLFGAGRWEAFPIDVWIERILRQQYRKRLKGPKLQSWAVNYFGENAGYAQQYLFHFARKTIK